MEGRVRIPLTFGLKALALRFQLATDHDKVTPARQTNDTTLWCSSTQRSPKGTVFMCHIKLGATQSLRKGDALWQATVKHDERRPLRGSGRQRCSRGRSDHARLDQGSAIEVHLSAFAR
jgi:hypothetical protein